MTDPISLQAWLEQLGPTIPAAWLARVAGVSDNTARRAIAAGTIPVHQATFAGHTFRVIRLEDVRRYQRTIRPPGRPRTN